MADPGSIYEVVGLVLCYSLEQTGRRTHQHHLVILTISHGLLWSLFLREGEEGREEDDATHN